MATLHFICGKAASGKTTLARELAARHAAVMFGEDEWLTLLDAEINSLADHVLHYIVASDESCKARLRLRNETKPEGLYFGSVSEDRFDEVTRYFTPPSDQENFHVIYYEAETPSSKG